MATIPYANVTGVERLPIDSQVVVTRANVVILGARAGREPQMLRNYVVTSEFPTIGAALTYVPEPLIYRYVADETINAEACFDLPEGYDPFLPPADSGVPEPSVTTGFTNAGSPSAIRDGDPITFAEGSGDSQLISFPMTAKVAGFRLKYTSEGGGTAAIHINSNTAGAISTWATYILPVSSVPVEMCALLPQDARNAWENTGDGSPLNPVPPFGRLEGATSGAIVSVTFNAGATKVYEFYPLIPNEVLLDAVAQEQLRLPAALPQRLTVTGVVAPDVEHTVTGWPGGDLTAPVAQQQYQLGRTIIDLEQAGALIGLRADSAEAVRERRAAINRAVQTAGYAVRMGERQ